VRDEVPAIDIAHYEYRRRWHAECQGGLKSLESFGEGQNSSAPAGRPKPAPLTQLGRRLAGLEPWPAEVPLLPAYVEASGLPPWESENLAPLLFTGARL
jgi:hypothetical protein